MTKSDLVKRLAKANPHLYTRDVERIVATVSDQIGAAAAKARLGSVALAGRRRAPPALLGSGGEAEDPVDEGALGRDVVRGHHTHLSLGQHRHRLASTPARVRRAVQKPWKPSIGPVRRLIRRWSRSTA